MPQNSHISQPDRRVETIQDRWLRRQIGSREDFTEPLGPVGPAIDQLAGREAGQLVVHVEHHLGGLEEGHHLDEFVADVQGNLDRPGQRGVGPDISRSAGLELAGL